MNFLDIVAKRRGAAPHTEDELSFLARGAAEGTIPDYQLSAWLMAAVLNPLTPAETVWLTMAMARSGKVLDQSALPKPRLDKHSTGGVGDKTTIVLLPLLAACGVTCVKMSGRGLGITGGTVDKLESVPGFRMDLSPDELLATAKKVGCSITGSTVELAPADKALYALRDATGTVASVPLIVSSILSKKIAAGAETVVLDVKCGSGSFMANFDEAETLAKALKETGELCGLKVKVVITDMNQPLGRTVGNALEVREALEVLSGDLMGRFANLCLQLAGIALHAVGRAQSPEDGTSIAHEAIKRGHAVSKATEWFEAQGASASIVRTINGMGQASIVRDVVYEGPTGWVAKLDARTVGETAVSLGAGRQTKTDRVDPSVGIEVLAPIGHQVASGMPIYRIHANDEASFESAKIKLMQSFMVSSKAIPEPPLILATM